MSRRAPLIDSELGALTCDLLTRDVAIFQRVKGHRFSSDDVATAYVAFGAAPHAKRVLDLGCGIGSVLLHMAWNLPEATLVGIEVQEVSYALLRRNVARSGYGARVTVQLGDIRDPEVMANVGPPFDLVTGTPPYFAPDAALGAADAQRAYARLEYRGGVEAYLAAGALALAEDGAMVLCGDARAQQRVDDAAQANGLALIARRDVTTWAGRPPLFSVWTLARAARPFAVTTLVLRDEHGAPTHDAARLRAFSGFPPRAGA